MAIGVVAFSFALVTSGRAVADEGEETERDAGAESETAPKTEEKASEGGASTTGAGVVEVPTVEVESQSPESAGEGEPTRQRTEWSSEELERRGFDSLDEALQWMSSSSSAGSSQTSQGLIVEGLPASQLEVLRDGMPVARKQGSRTGTSVDLSAIQLDPDEIERIEVYRGLGPAGTGDAGGVVVNIVSRPEAERLELGADGGVTGVPMRLANGRASGDVSTPLGGPWSLRTAGGYARKRAVDVNDDGVYDLPSTASWNASASLGWRPDRDRRFRLRLAASRKATDVPADPESPLYNSVDTGDYRALVSGEWRPADRWRIEHRSEFGLFRHDFRKVVRQSGFERPKSTTREYGTSQNVVATHFFDAHDLSLELSGEADRVVRRGETGTLDPVTLASIGSAVSETWYVSEEWTLNSRLYGDIHSRFGPGWLGRVGAAWAFVEDWKLRASLSRSRRLPTAEEMFLFFDHSEIGYQIEGNPNLSPERTRSARIGVEARFFDGALRTSVEGFYHRLSDLIGTVSASTGESSEGVALFTYDNIAEAHTAGVEAGLGARRLGAGFGVDLSYTYLPLAENRTTRERLALRARHSGHLEVRRRWVGGDLTTWARTSLRSSMPTGTEPAPGYAVAGVGFEWQMHRIVAASLDARNLLDQTNPTWGPKPGINVLAQLHVDWREQRESE